MLLDKQKVFIIAEAGVNHNGSLDIAKKMIDTAKECNADAIKFQTFVANEVVTKTAPKAEYQEKSSTGKTQQEMISEFELTKAEFCELKKYCDSCGITFLSTPFDLGSLAFLTTSLDVPVIKIASGEITNAPLLYHAALSDKPIILSTGMATLAEIQEALGVLAFGYIDKKNEPSIKKFRDMFISDAGKNILKKQVTLLHCTSAYPAPYDDVNLKVLMTLQQAFELEVGYSDHTLGIYASLGAVCYGAKIIEKHFTLDKNQIGPDHAASLSPNELKELISAVRIIERCLGNPNKGPTPSEVSNIEICRRSLVARTSIREGDKFSELLISAKRPANGVSPMNYWEYLNSCATKDYQMDEMLDSLANIK